MKVGNVIKNKSGLYVITRITNRNVSETEELEKYIIRNAMVKEDDEWKTISEVIAKRCLMYLDSGIEIIEEK